MTERSVARHAELKGPRSCLAPELVDVTVKVGIRPLSSKQSYHNGFKSANTHGSGRPKKRSSGDTSHTDNQRSEPEIFVPDDAGRDAEVDFRTLPPILESHQLYNRRVAHHAIDPQ